jgi:hypothetical protein
MSVHFPTVDINPEPTMTQNRYSSPIPSSISGENVDNHSSTESDVEWLGPENQLGLGPENQLGLEPDDRTVGLDKEGKINHHETNVIY